MDPLRPFMFDVFALSLPKGLGFGDEPPVNAWVLGADARALLFAVDNWKDEFGDSSRCCQTSNAWATTSVIAGTLELRVSTGRRCSFAQLHDVSCAFEQLIEREHLRLLQI